MQHRWLVAVGVVCLVVAGLFWAVAKIRRRYREGRQAVQDLKQQARSMHLDGQGMATSVGETSGRKKLPET